MRTMTQRTTLPFLILESGAASFTAAVTTSPSPARSPRSPPRGRMHESLRAPLLSATSRIVLIPIMAVVFLYFLKLFLNFDVEIGRFSRTNQRRTSNHFFEAPALQLAHRAALRDSHHIAHLRSAF